LYRAELHVHHKEAKGEGARGGVLGEAQEEAHGTKSEGRGPTALGPQGGEAAGGPQFEGSSSP